MQGTTAKTAREILIESNKLNPKTRKDKIQKKPHDLHEPNPTENR
jgi:hypothetical protein